MNISILSDSHDNLDRLKMAVQISNSRQCEWLLHLGDIISPYTTSVLAGFKGKVRAVFGNCDGDKIGISEAFKRFTGEIFPSPHALEICGKKIAIMHEPYYLDELILSKGFDYLFYGHLHQIDYRKIQGTTIINPGEVAGISAESTFFTGNLQTGDFETINLK